MEIERTENGAWVVLNEYQVRIAAFTLSHDAKLFVQAKLEEERELRGIEVDSPAVIVRAET